VPTHLHKLCDIKLGLQGHPNVRDLMLGPLASMSLRDAAAWITATAGEPVEHKRLFDWFADDYEVQAARAAARK
jgi:hypothetical protein